MKTIIEKATELEKGKFYIFKVPKNASSSMLLRLKNKLIEEGFKGIIYCGDIEIMIPKKEK